MYKMAISLTVAAALAVFGTQVVHARGFGGAHAGGGSSAGGSHGSSYHGSSQSGGYHSSSSSAETYHGANGASAAHGSEGTVAKGPEGNVYAHPSSSDDAYHGATTAHGAEGTAVKGPEGDVYAHPSSSGDAYRGAEGATYAHGAAGYSAGHTALPTDAGYGMSAPRTGTAAYAGYHQTEAVSGSVAAARGASVRTAFSAPGGLYGQGWHAANPGAWAPAGWTAGRAWSAATWPAVGASLGWGSVQPIAYNYGTNITYQDNQVYYGDQPVATAGDYYQQAATVAASAPAPAAQSDDWLPLGVFALVQKEQSDPNYVMQLAVNKSGALGGNYTDLVSGTTRPIQGAVDKKTQRVAWTIGNNKTTVGETGLYNLTQDEAPALIHIGKDKTQQWLLVRLKQPEQAAGEK